MLGGLRGAIEMAINRALVDAQVDPAVPRDRAELLALLRRAFVPALVAIDPETNLPRRRIARIAEILPLAQPVVLHLVEQRILVTDVRPGSSEPIVEVAHEAILRQWALLREWLAEDATLLQLLDRVKRAARDLSVTRDMSGFRSTRSVRFLPEGSHAAGGQNGPDHRCDWVASSEEVELR
jgi:hypothetical protein